VVCFVIIDAVWEREQVNLTWVWWWVSNTAATSLLFMDRTRQWKQSACFRQTCVFAVGLKTHWHNQTLFFRHLLSLQI